MESAKKMGNILLEEKLAACVQFSRIQSEYLWEGKIMCDEEVLVTIKTKRDLYAKIEAIIHANHEYEVPQIYAIAVDKGSENYLNWIASNLENNK